ncbi:MAG: alpha-glucan family phosphorylase [Anaerolineae bacterium]|nr:alpha-glucan family phosphorylase [Anaerolineae bacterium]MDW8172207.1 alpha-glucan family phosphorylase [Anaerolineae bacterium]
MVKPIATLQVLPKLPEPLARLEDLAYNLRFAWDQDTLQLFRRLDPDLWEEVYHNPVKLLGRISQEKLEAARNDPAYMANFERTLEAFDNYMHAGNGWFSDNYRNLPRRPLIAYFSMEFGIHECFQNYSGGLGVLSGDHLKSASDLNIPLVGVGLLYQEGYFQQYLNADGWQQESYPINDFSALPLRLERDADGQPLRIDVQLPGRKLYAQVWRAQVGRVPLYLLDTNIPDNPREEDRSLTDRLYGGDRRTRIRQEILIGIGGIRALDALGLQPDVIHMNEGHSAFSGLERIRVIMHKHKLSFEQAREIVAASTVFTLHTPVPAGLERFGYDLIDEHFSDYMRELGLTREQFHDLGRENMGTYDLFSMSVMALKMCYGANGVAKLHGVVSRNMWQWMYPGVPKDEVPVGSVTNGVHVQTWVSREMGALFDRYLDPSWRVNDARPEVWSAAANIPDAELWRTHVRRRERLIAFTRARLKKQLIARGATSAAIAEAEEVLNPEALTIGFARRFATYKRATLIFNDLKRLDALVNNPERPVQFIFAGKAHPHDNEGKAFIREIVRIANLPQFRHSIVFIENYDMNVTRYMLQGCDVWLNNPRRPKEASGTSGMKAIYNGCLNFSILDGWWDEAYHPGVGWAIGNGEEYNEAQEAEQDRLEADSLYNVLEHDIVPRFFAQGRDGVPRDWVRMMKQALQELAPVFTTDRMVAQYTHEYYIPSFERLLKMETPDLTPALAYVNWRAQLKKGWQAVNVVEVTMSDQAIKVGSESNISARVQLGTLTPQDVRVQLYYGALNTRGDIIKGYAADMELVRDLGNGLYEYRISQRFTSSGEQGISVRVVPHHEYLASPFQTALIRWAR